MTELTIIHNYQHSHAKLLVQCTTNVQVNIHIF